MSIGKIRRWKIVITPKKKKKSSCSNVVIIRRADIRKSNLKNSEIEMGIKR